MRSDCVFFCPIRVRYGEVDQQGVVYNGNYVVYTDFAFGEFFRSRGCSYHQLVHEHQSEICHKKSTFEYISSLYEDDMAEVGVRVIKIGTKSVTLGYEIYRQGEEEPLVIAQVVYVGYDKEHRKSRPITDLMRRLLQEAQA